MCWYRRLCLVFSLLIISSFTQAKPQRIVSMNLCTDQILLQLVAPQRIASVTHLATQPEYSFHWRKARGLHANTGLAEQIIPLGSDLILAANFNLSGAVGILTRLELPVALLEIPRSLTSVAAFVRKIGALVGEETAAELLIEKMNQSMRDASSKIVDVEQHRPLAVIYAPNGYTAGANTLKHELLTAAGYRNLAAELGIEIYGRLSIEQLLYAKPDLLIIDDSTTNQNSLAQRFTTHPAFIKSLPNNRFLRIRSNRWLCAGPMAAEVVATLANVGLP